jgi:hypothetical protein
VNKPGQECFPDVRDFARKHPEMRNIPEKENMIEGTVWYVSESSR